MQQLRWGPHNNLHKVSALPRPLPHTQGLRCAPCPLPPPRHQPNRPLHTRSLGLHAAPGPMPPLKEPHSPAAQPLKPCAPPQQPSASPSLNPSAPPTCILVYGVDFTSRPTSRKPLTVAHGQLLLPQRVLQVQTLSRLATHQQLSDLLFGPGLGTEGGDEVPKEGESETQAAPAPATGRLPAQSLNMRCKEGTSASTASLSPPAKSPTATTGSTAQRAAPNASTTTCTSTDSTSASISPRQHVRVAALDFPFGQPRGLVDALGWGPGWRDLVRHTTQRRSQQEFEAALKAFMARQPPGAKHLKRAVAAHSREVSPMSLVRTPTAKMFWVGAGLLAAAADAGRALLPHHLPPPLQPSSSLPFRQAPPCSCATAEAHQYGQCRTGRTGQEELQEGGRHEGDPEATCPSLGDSPGERVCGHVPVPLPVCVCVEAYPALPARRVLSRPGAGGRAVSYKSDAAAGAADGARREARRAVLRALMHAAEPAGHAAAVAAADEASPATLEGLAGALEREAVGSLQQTRARGLPPGGEAQCVDGCGGSEAPGEVHGGGGSTAVSLAAEFGLQRVELEAGVARQCEEDPSGDSLDAVLAALQAAWAALRGPAGNWGGPPLAAGFGSAWGVGGGGGAAGAGGSDDGARSELMEGGTDGHGGGAGDGVRCAGAGGTGVDPVEGWVADPGVWAAHCAAEQQRRQGGGEQGQGNGSGKGRDGREARGEDVAAGRRGRGGKRKRAGS